MEVGVKVADNQCDQSKKPSNSEECDLKECPKECVIGNLKDKLKNITYNNVPACINDSKILEKNYNNKTQIKDVDDKDLRVCSGGKYIQEFDIITKSTETTPDNKTCKHKTSMIKDGILDGDKIYSWADCNLNGDVSVCNSNGTCNFDSDSGSLSCKCKNNFFQISNNNCYNMTCPTGYREDTENENCIPNICTCDNGTPVGGRECYQNGIQKCKKM